MNIPEGRQPWIRFMLDNGASVNLIKLNALREDLRVRTSEVIKLGGNF